MLLLKTRYENIPGVIENSKHATHQYPRAEPGDLVLIAITKGTLPKGMKSIQYVARLKSVRPDTAGQAIEIWKNPWRYIIELSDVREVTPFNLEEVVFPTAAYGAVRTHCRLRPEDEAAVLRWIGNVQASKAAEPRPNWHS